MNNEKRSERKKVMKMMMMMGGKMTIENWPFFMRFWVVVFPPSIVTNLKFVQIDG